MRTHGKRSTYVKGKCRCDLCREVNRQECAQAKASRMARGVPADVPHGTRSTYTNWGCRCYPCKVANTDGCRDYYIRRAQSDNET